MSTNFNKTSILTKTSKHENKTIENIIERLILLILSTFNL